MRVLYVTGAFPYPLTSGFLRHYFFIRELAQRRHEITLLAQAGPRFEPAHAAELERYAERVWPFSGSSSRHRVVRALRRAGAFAQGPDAARAARLMKSAIERLLAAERFDVVFLAGKAAFATVDAVRDGPLVADLCDAASVRLRSALRYDPPERLLFSAMEYAEIRRIEQGMIRRADRLVFASARDQEALVGNHEPHAAVVPNGVDLDFWRRTTPDLGLDTIVFTGVMSYPPNTDAALQLIHEILPRVRRRVEGARLLLVGRNPSWRLRRAARHPGVELTGYVADVRPYLEQATVFAAPLRFGAGIQNKLLEAMAMELPAVVSPLVAGGLASTNGDRPPLDVAADPDEMAHLICQTLEQRRQQVLAVHREGRRFVADHFQWSRSAEALEAVLMSAIRGASQDRKACSPSH